MNIDIGSKIKTLRQAKTADGSFQQTYESYVEKYQLPVPSSNV